MPTFDYYNFSFQTPPPSLHGLISLVTFAGYSNDVTLLQATLKEILKLIGMSLTSHYYHMIIT